MWFKYKYKKVKTQNPTLIVPIIKKQFDEFISLQLLKMPS